MTECNYRRAFEELLSLQLDIDGVHRYIRCILDSSTGQQQSKQEYNEDETMVIELLASLSSSSSSSLSYNTTTPSTTDDDDEEEGTLNNPIVIGDSNNPITMNITNNTIATRNKYGQFMKRKDSHEHGNPLGRFEKELQSTLSKSYMTPKSVKRYRGSISTL